MCIQIKIKFCTLNSFFISQVFFTVIPYIRGVDLNKFYCPVTG